MLGKNQLKYLRSLALKKYRDKEGVFVAEGRKVVDDLLGIMNCRMLLATNDYLAAHPKLPCCEIVPLNPHELEQASLLKTPRDVIAIFETPRSTPIEKLVWLPEKQLCLALDTIQDPGNLGTIIRIADWFGIEHIFCSTDTADAYSPKTIQATMGAIARVHVHYVPIVGFLENIAKETPIYGTFLEGENIYNQTLTANGVLIMGNEGNGISTEIKQLVNQKLYIPSFPAERATSESLNVAVATAIACAEFRRQARQAYL